MSKTIRLLSSAILLILFLGVEYFHLFSIETIAPYAIYFFECAWIALVWIVFKKIELLSKWTIKSFIVLALLLPLGWITHVIAQRLGMLVPFDFSGSEVVLFLLLVGPVLEEFIFRGMMWKLVEVWNPKFIFPALITSLVFSYSHYRAIFYIPEEFKPFVQYQTVYTFTLALICAWLRVKTGLVGAIFGHMIFNFGFWLARA